MDKILRYNIDMNIPITQSKYWHKLQEDLGEESFLEAGSGYQYLAILKTTPVGNYFYLPYGPVVKDRLGFHNSIKSLKHLAEQHNAIFIRIEPIEKEIKHYFPAHTIKSTDLNPKETWLLDLKGTEDDLKAKLPSRLLRYHRNAEKNGIFIETSHNPEDIHYLLDLQKSLAKKKGISTFSESYLKTELSQPFATLYLVKHKDENDAKSEIIAAGLVFDDQTTRYNLQGAQSESARSLHATGILTIQLILDAKKKGLKTFDFWGIAPEGAPDNHPWKGFTNFKKTFAGYEVEHAGTHDIVLKPAKYKLYQALRKINRRRKK